MGFASNVRRIRGRNNEGVVALAIIILIVAVGLFDNTFWSMATVFNLFRNSYEPLFLALDVFLILLIGGIDVSFAAIGIFAGYTVASLIVHLGVGDSLWGAFIISALIGGCLGLVNAVTIVLFRLPVLIVTLGTRGVFAGLLLALVGSSFISNLPANIKSFGTDFIMQLQTGSGETIGLQILVIPAAVICILIGAFLRYTLIGKGAYAIGDNEEAARRAGFPVIRIKFIIFCLAGVLAGIAGMTHVSLIGFASPQDMVGNELLVLAAVVMGGASIYGGRGSVTGIVLGVLLIELIQYSLVMLGIPSSWNKVVIGLFLLLGMIMQVAPRYRGASA